MINELSNTFAFESLGALETKDNYLRGSCRKRLRTT